MKGKKHIIFPLILIIISITGILIGIIDRNIYTTVFLKAVSICLECIGIG